MYKVWTESDIRKHLDEAGEKMNMFCSQIPVIISGRMTKCKGKFSFQEKRVNCKNTIIPVKFTFAKILLDGRYSEEIVKQTILHEYVHFYTNVKYNKNHRHNRFFKSNCKKLGISDNTYFTAEPLESVACRDKVITEYRIKCSCCGKTVAIRRRKDSVRNILRTKISSCCKAELVM